MEDDVGTFAAEFQGDLAAGAGELTLNAASDRCGASERNLVDARMIDQCRSHIASTGDDVHDTRRHIGIRDDLGQHQDRQWRGLGRLDHHGVARSERRCDLPRCHQQWKVPGDHLPGNTEWLRTGS